MRELLPKLAALPNTPLPAVAWYVASALKIVRVDDWAEPSFAARREARRLGIAIAAIMPMIATTISSSINEKPSWRLVVILVSCSLREIGGSAKFSRQRLSSLCDAAQSANCPSPLQQHLCH